MGAIASSTRAIASSTTAIASSTTTPAGKKRCYLFVGNPGTGKSSLINGVVGRILFKSAASFDGS